MKRFVFLCVLLAGAAFAAETNLGNLGNGGVTLPGQFPGTDDVITSQPFSFENLQNGLGFQNGSGYTWMLADDITPAGDTPITDIEIWDCYSGSQMTGLKVQIRADGGSRPTGDPLYSYETTNITHTTTGLFAWGSYELFDVVATIDPANAYSPTPGTKVWFCLQATGCSSTAYWCACYQTWGDMCYWSQDNGSNWTSSLDQWATAYDTYMILEGEAALTTDTWAGIKSSF
ncbi:MAG: hypothetical protein GX473_00760 [Candidatus Fermentibacter daniensis]|nr:MAG: hypothetical protein AO395_01265 [Candidatus Fermentibacter daniensis]MCC6871096.1 hypothetical protein [Candidatus Fermentibacter sp.]NLI01847.1 hypothetical protein [Candidatus Fermentibacter daniensis]